MTRYIVRGVRLDGREVEIHYRHRARAERGALRLAAECAEAQFLDAEGNRLACMLTRWQRDDMYRRAAYARLGELTGAPPPDVRRWLGE